MQGMDPYAYVGGNPETNTDPTGHFIVGANGRGYRTNSSGHITSSFKQDDQDWTPVYYLPTPTWTPTLYYSPPNDTFNSYHVVRHSSPAASDYTGESVKKKALDMLGQGVGIVGKGLDFIFGVTDMVNDVNTLNSNASLQDKFGSVVNLTVNGGMDISMIFGVGEALRGAELGGKLAVDLVEHLAEECGASLSFTPATLVLTSHGELAIGNLHKGEQVWAYNPKTHKKELEPIVKVWINHDNDLVDLTITSKHPAGPDKKATTKSEVVHTTKKHPFLTIEQGFLAVAKIKVGMHIQQADGHVGVITKWVSIPGAKTMYNLEVANDHTFVVGQGQWVVHNCSIPTASEAAQEAIDHLKNTPNDMDHVFGQAKHLWNTTGLSQSEHLDLMKQLIEEQYTDIVNKTGPKFTYIKNFGSWNLHVRAVPIVGNLIRIGTAFIK